MTHLDRLELQDYVNELTRRHTYREAYTVHDGGTAWTRRHLVKAPALIHQLLMATPTSADSPGTGGFRPQAPAHLEALDTLAWIDREAARWVCDLGEHAPVDRVDPRTGLTLRGSGTIACVLILNGLAASAEQVTVREIETDVRRWWTQARIVSGWDSPAWRPDNTCPACGVRGGIRVRLSEKSALCIECRALWDANSVGLLADHIRTENREAG